MSLFRRQICPTCLLLQAIIAEQNKLLMAFHKAGKDLAALEIDKAREETKRIIETSQLARAEAERYRAQAQLISSEGVRVSDSAPKHGERGHSRVLIQ